MQGDAIPGECASGAAGHDKAARDRFQALHGGVQVVGVAPAEGLVPVAEHQVHLRADHGLQAFAEELHHARVGKAEYRLHTRGFGQFPGADGGCAPRVRGDQITLDIQVL